MLDADLLLAAHDGVEDDLDNLPGQGAHGDGVGSAPVGGGVEDDSMARRPVRRGGR